VFVEVKTRSNVRHGTPEEAVDARKQARIVRGAGAWLRAHPRRVRRVRFDVIACEARATGQWQLRHWPGAFEAGG
jgi:putative endonuclease